jgi:calcium binding protein 39
VPFDFGQPELITQLAQQMYSTDLLLLVQNIARFDFEAQKNVVQIFSSVRLVPDFQQ